MSLFASPGCVLLILGHHMNWIGSLGKMFLHVRHDIALRQNDFFPYLPKESCLDCRYRQSTHTQRSSNDLCHIYVNGETVLEDVITNNRTPIRDRYMGGKNEKNNAQNGQLIIRMITCLGQELI